jgi:hypothetical protein
LVLRNKQVALIDACTVEDPRDEFRLINHTVAANIIAASRSDRSCLSAKIAELALAGYCEKAAPKSVKLASRLW